MKTCYRLELALDALRFLGALFGAIVGGAAVHAAHVTRRRKASKHHAAKGHRSPPDS